MNQLEYKELWDSYDSALVIACSRQDYARAESLLFAALKESEDLGELDGRLVDVSHGIADACISQTRLSHARDIYYQVLETVEKILGTGHPACLRILAKLTLLRSSRGLQAS